MEGSAASDGDEFRLKTSAEEMQLKYAVIVHYVSYDVGLNVCVCVGYQQIRTEGSKQGVNILEINKIQ